MSNELEEGLDQLRRNAPEVDQAAQALYAEIMHSDSNTLDANQAHTDVSTKLAQITNPASQILVLADMILTDQKQHQDKPDSSTLRLFPEAANHDGDSAPARMGVWSQAVGDKSLTDEQLKYDTQVKQEILQKAACITSLKQAVIEDSTCRRGEGPWQALDRMMGHDVSSATKLKIDHAIKLLYRQEHGGTDISDPEDRKNHRGLPDVPVGYQWINDSNFGKLCALSPEFKAWFDAKCATAAQQVAGDTTAPATGADTTPPPAPAAGADTTPLPAPATGADTTPPPAPAAGADTTPPPAPESSKAQAEQVQIPDGPTIHFDATAHTKEHIVEIDYPNNMKVELKRDGNGQVQEGQVLNAPNADANGRFVRNDNGNYDKLDDSGHPTGDSVTSIDMNPDGSGIIHATKQVPIVGAVSGTVVVHKDGSIEEHID